ncbi:MAG: cell division protein FtsI [Lachnospiraceae bacterium]|nr:cell division protein FtsI [Lachnospiraceae bacterium]
MKKRSNINRFSREMQKKLVVLSFLVMAAFVLLAVRLFFIFRDNGQRYKKQVYSQQSYDSTSLPFKRGDIVDRKGSKLAYSEKVYNLIIDSKLLMSDEGIHLEPTLNAVRKYFKSVDTAALREYAEKNPSSQYRVFAKKLPYDDIQAYLEFEEENRSEEDENRVAGVWFEEDYKREYPYGSLACDLLGFTQGENSGYFGLEEYYNSVLNGTNGRRYGYLTEDSVVEQTIKPATDGNTIVSTIDTNIQSIVEKHLLKFSEAHKNEAREGNGANNIGCIIMDPNTGEVLAMASYPSFDLSNPRDLSPFYSEEEIGGMDEEEKLEALNRVWRNFCISDTYEPGSTAKPFTVASAIEDGAIRGDESYNCNGALEVGEHVIHCHNRLGDGTLTVSQGIQKSCNVVLMNVAFALGKDRWLKYNRAFNFGLKTNIDLSGEVNASSLVFNEKMGQTDLAVGSFGQGFNVTMIQMASAYCSLINGGYYYQPHVVSKIMNAEGATVEDIEPRVLKQTISNSTSSKIREMMKSVVMEGTEGTGWSARPAGYTMGGKTGTAEKIPRDKRNYVVSFCGYVPADDPKVLSYVVIDQPNVIAQDNARLATTLTMDIMTEVLPYMNIFMTEELTDDERAELEEMQMDFSLDAETVKEQSDEAEGAEGAEGEAAEGEGAAEGESNSPDEADAPAGGDDLETTTVEMIGAGEGANEEGTEGGIRYDEATGYPIDPNTGQVLDPETLLPIEGSTSFMD